MTNESPNIIIEVTTNPDGTTATDRGGKKYKIESLTLGIGSNRKPIPYTKKALAVGCKYRAEILPNKKLNIL
jgi:hypothetical protein